MWGQRYHGDCITIRDQFLFINQTISLTAQIWDNFQQPSLEDSEDTGGGEAQCEEMPDVFLLSRPPTDWLSRYQPANKLRLRKWSNWNVFLYNLFKVSNTSHPVYCCKCFKVLFLKMSEKMIFVIPACIGSSWLQVINLSLELGNYSQKCWLRFPVILTHSWGRPALTRSSNVHWADPLLPVACML